MMVSRKVDLSSTDADGTPAGAETMAQRLVERDPSMSLSGCSPRSNYWRSRNISVSTRDRRSALLAPTT